MDKIINKATSKYIKSNAPKLRAGYVVRVSEKITEGNRERIQVFEGLVLSVKHGTGVNGTFTVRKIAQGRIGVERTFPLHMPFLEKIEVLKQEKVRRSKLYFVREQINKKTKKRKTKEKNVIFEMSALPEVEEDKVEKEETTTEEARKDEEILENKDLDNKEENIDDKEGVEKIEEIKEEAAKEDKSEKVNDETKEDNLEKAEEQEAKSE